MSSRNRCGLTDEQQPNSRRMIQNQRQHQPTKPNNSPQNRNAHFAQFVAKFLTNTGVGFAHCTTKAFVGFAHGGGYLQYVVELTAEQRLAGWQIIQNQRQRTEYKPAEYGKQPINQIAQYGDIAFKFRA